MGFRVPVLRQRHQVFCHSRLHSSSDQSSKRKSRNWLAKKIKSDTFSCACMEKKYPQRLFIQGNEPQVDKINNSCRMSILTKMKEALPLEYAIVQKDPVFAPIFALHENSLGYSGRLIHSMLTRQLVTKTKDEMWFVFGKKPLRFLMQEFHAITGLNCKDDFSSDIEKWTDDEARYKLAVGLWEAASDPVLIERMKKFEPPELSSDFVDLA